MAKAGGAITNRVSSIDNIQLPNPPRYSQGSFIIDGGDYYNNDTSWQYGMVGHQIGGYVQMRGGKWRSNGWTCFGHGSYGYGAFEMLGGTTAAAPTAPINSRLFMFTVVRAFG